MLIKRNSGFSLVELIITMTIIGILSGVAVLSLGYVNRKTVSNQCITNYQAVSLAYSSYQSDNSGSSPGEIANLTAFGYINSNLIVNPKFAIQNSVYKITGYAISGTTNTLTISASWLSAIRPPIYTSGSVINISNLETQLNGTFNLVGSPVYLSDTSYKISYTLDPTVDVSTLTPSFTYTDNPSPPRSVNVFSTVNQPVSTSGSGTSVPYETYVFDNSGNLKSGIAPAACGLLTG